MNCFSTRFARFAFGAIAASFVFGFVSCARMPDYSDGEYIASGEGRNGPIEIRLTVRNGKPVEVEVLRQEENDFAVPAQPYVIEKFLANGSTSKIAAYTGATITTNGMVAAINAALAMAQGKASETGMPSAVDTECDIVIVGAGGAGLCAAIEAADNGAKVIVLEKMGIVGGNTNSATGGLNASETKYQKEQGIADSNEQYYKDTMSGGYNKNDPDLVRVLVEKSAETVDWLVSKGADLVDVGKMAGSTNSRTHRPKGGAAVGAYLVPVLEKAARESGAEIRLNSKVVDIIDEGGAAAGVRVEAANGSYNVRAKAVIIATGGMGANIEMIARYNPAMLGFGTTNHRGATGDAFAWIEKFGAQLIQMEEIQTHPTVVPGDGTMITEAVRGNGAILVNSEGKRFGSEMATRDVMSAAILQQSGQVAYLVFDDDVRKSLKAIEGYVSMGLLTQDDTVEGLAAKLNIPADNLKTTMDAYAAFVASGQGDGDFGRKANEMPRALTEGPFYAVAVGPAIHHTMGGIKINTRAEVVAASGAAVPGLYAAGEVTGGVHGGNRLGGNAVADICVYGKIAADSALEYIK